MSFAIVTAFAYPLKKVKHESRILCSHAKKKITYEDSWTAYKVKSIFEILKSFSFSLFSLKGKNILEPHKLVSEGLCYNWFCKITFLSQVVGIDVDCAAIMTMTIEIGHNLSIDLTNFGRHFQ